MTRRTPVAMPLTAVVLGAFIALPAVAIAQQAKTPSSVSESAPGRTGPATTPTGPGGRQISGGAPAYPPSGPSGVSESQPATAGPGSTPTAGQGQSANVGKTESSNRLPQTPSSVSESAPARTGKAMVPTARYTPKWSEADANRDGVIDRFEFDRWMSMQHSSKR